MREATWPGGSELGPLDTLNMRLVVAGSYSGSTKAPPFWPAKIALLLRRKTVGQRRLQAENGREQKGRSASHEALTRMVPSAITVPEKILPLSVLRTLIRSPAAPGCSDTAVAEMVRSPAMK